MTESRADARVLIVAPEPLLAALLGMLVDSIRMQAVFPKPNESALDAVARVRPAAAVLIDAAFPDAGSDLLLARVRASGTILLLFGQRDALRGRMGWAREQSVPAFVVPDQVDDLALALGSIQRGRRRSADRREPSGRTADGTLYLDDGRCCWYVYDRRASDRRGGEVDRRFVSDRGEVRHCFLTEDEAAHTGAADLETQLAAAVR